MFNPDPLKNLNRVIGKCIIGIYKRDEALNIQFDDGTSLIIKGEEINDQIGGSASLIITQRATSA